MEFRISDTFTDSLSRLTGDEQKAVKTTAFDLQLNPANPGMQFHKLSKSRDPNFWSIRVSSDVRVIVHRTGASLLLCYVGHHDDAYGWAERRKLEVHPRTGAAQLVEIRETVKEVVIPRYVEEEVQAPPKPKLFAQIADEDLLGYGVPAEWVPDVREADEDSILDLADHLPGEAAEALLDIAVGVQPERPEPVAEPADPFEHPDAQRRFRLMTNVEELELALEFPWEKWSVFLHPSQRDLVERDFNGPARVTGSAGTGKTVVALHRAVWLARSQPEARVLLTTFSEPLANNLRIQLRRLIGNLPRLAERLQVQSIESVAQRLYEGRFGAVQLVHLPEVRGLLETEQQALGETKFTGHFLAAEWDQVVDAWQLDSWQAYRDVQRLGRRTRLPQNQREQLWKLFEKVRQQIESRGLVTHAKLFTALAVAYEEGANRPFDHIVVDEAQDLSIAQLRFLGAIAGDLPNGLFFAGDLGQRIFQQPFSWLAIGVDVRGRARRLRINYRTSHQIRSCADQLLPPEIADVDGLVEERKGTVSVFNGPQPEIAVFESEPGEKDAIRDWLLARLGEGVLPHEIAVFVRSEEEIPRAASAVNATGAQAEILDASAAPAIGKVSVATMHLAKGLEFKAVVVMACDEDVLPNAERIGAVGDQGDLEDVYNTERHLLYVACTRARDRLLVSGTAPGSVFLDDLTQG